MEKWKNIIGFEGIYQISDLGRVKSLERKVPFRNGFRYVKERILKPSLNNKGYLTTVLSNKKEGTSKTVDIHNLVAIHFLGYKGKKSGFVVDHIDNSKRTDNSIENLQITTYRNNRAKDIDKTKTTSKYIGVHWHKSANKWASSIRLGKGNRKYLGLFESEEEAYLVYQKALKNI
jgi:hypothetical protein